KADTENHGPCLLNRGFGIAKVARFLGTTRGIIFGIKIKDHLLARKVFQTDRFSRLVGKRQGGSPLTDCKFLWHTHILLVRLPGKMLNKPIFSTPDARAPKRAFLHASISHRSEVQRIEVYTFASSLAAALMDSLFKHPVRYRCPLPLPMPVLGGP